MNNADLADKAAKCELHVPGDRFFHGNVLVPVGLLAEIIAALRRSEHDVAFEAEKNFLHGKLSEKLERACAERPPSSDQVLVPRELTPAMHEAGLRFAGTLHANYEDCWKVLLAAAEAKGHHE